MCGNVAKGLTKVWKQTSPLPMLINKARDSNKAKDAHRVKAEEAKAAGDLRIAEQDSYDRNKKKFNNNNATSTTPSSNSGLNIT